jgi:hypothetical protein
MYYEKKYRRETANYSGSQCAEYSSETIYEIGSSKAGQARPLPIPNRLQLIVRFSVESGGTDDKCGIIASDNKRVAYTSRSDEKAVKSL